MCERAWIASLATTAQDRNRRVDELGVGVLINRLLRRGTEARATDCPRGPDGSRIYAIGDVHGRLDLLERLISLIDQDDASRQPAQTYLIMLGDLVDRGPDSAGVVALIRALMEQNPKVRLIKGNHEEIFIAAARGNERAARGMIEVGGMPTLQSYGITEDAANRGTFGDLVDLIGKHVPEHDIDFLDAGEDMIVMGDYLFVHAGIRPGVPLREQRVSDLRWIRGDFLRSRERHPGFVVHGHSIFEKIDERNNRIGLDTGAFATGILSAIGIEGNERWFLGTSGP